jgi:N-methylhydantoinase A/oxoprolinase/acetone carboxylase beta subunit
LKVHSTPKNFAAGVINGIREFKTEVTGIGAILHGTNVVTNAVVVGFLHSYANPRSEQKAEVAIRKTWPNDYIVVSSDLLREFREFERRSTTACNAFPIFFRFGVPYKEFKRTEELFVDMRKYTSAVRNTIPMKEEIAFLEQEEVVY